MSISADGQVEWVLVSSAPVNPITFKGVSYVYNKSVLSSVCPKSEFCTKASDEQMNNNLKTLQEFANISSKTLERQYNKLYPNSTSFVKFYKKLQDLYFAAHEIVYCLSCVNLNKFLSYQHNQFQHDKYELKLKPDSLKEFRFQVQKFFEEFQRENNISSVNVDDYLTHLL